MPFVIEASLPSTYLFDKKTLFWFLKNVVKRNLKEKLYYVPIKSDSFLNSKQCNLACFVDPSGSLLLICTTCNVAKLRTLSLVNIFCIEYLHFAPAVTRGREYKNQNSIRSSVI